ncbi:hydroxymethylbilane synthase [Rhodothalassium salexigens]|nr:hydroxymethylbilane synthase [Rhodothalassium salexigens]MBK5911323.1 hydroxymethylbilane synthase [Rhodothalassium salexigens]MBK5921440.1 hydroxymethylbilane synthase [Rhodothalassium salexigens]
MVGPCVQGLSRLHPRIKLVQDGLRIGTRKSPLAMAQTEQMRQRILAANPSLSDEATVLAPMTTTGDQMLSGPLMEVGGKGLFTRELDDALLAGTIDLAVHSAKDLPTVLPDGIELITIPEREDPYDAWIGADNMTVDQLPQGAKLGSASLRRRAQILARRPDLVPVVLRGNVGTRLDKLARGDAHATMLAHAGLRRLGKTDVMTCVLDEALCLPAPTQGILAITARTGDERVARILAPLEDPTVRAQATAERAFLATLDGSCRTPIAALSRVEGDRVHLTGRVLPPNGSECYEIAGDAPVAEAEALGLQLGRDMRAKAGEAFFAALPQMVADAWG